MELQSEKNEATKAAADWYVEVQRLRAENEALHETAKTVVEARTNLDKAPTLTREYDRCNTALNDAIGDLAAKIGLER